MAAVLFDICRKKVYAVGKIVTSEVSIMKKLLSIGVSLLLILTMLSCGLSVAAANPTVSLPDLTAKPGETVSVVIRLKDNPGLISAKVKVGYDAAALEFVDVELGDFPTSGYSNGDPKKNPYVVNFCNGVATADYTAEVFATLQFRIKADAKAGKYPLTLTCDLEGDFFNHDWDTVYFTMDEGSVTVVSDAAASTTPTASGDTAASTTASPVGGSTAENGDTPTQSGSADGDTTTSADGAEGVVGSTAPSDGAGDGTDTTSPSADDGDGDAKTEKKRAPLTLWLAIVPIAAVILIALTIHLVSAMRKKQNEPQ